MKTSCIIKFLIYIAVSYIFCKYKNFIYIYIYESIYIEGIIGTRNLIFLPMYRLVVWMLDNWSIHMYNNKYKL